MKGTIGLILLLAGAASNCMAQTASPELPPAAQEVAPALPAVPAASGDRPLTQLQFETYMHDSMLLDASRKLILETLDQQRRTVPPWLPDVVWNDFKRRVAEIDYITLLLPLYQKNFSERDGIALDLMFAGPTGHEYAQAVLDSRIEAMRTGLQGSAAEKAAMKSPMEARVKELQQKRARELTPEQLASVQSIGAKRGKKMQDGFNLDDEENVLIQERCRVLIREAAKAHQAEMAAAQKAYAAKHPGGG